MSNKKFFRAFGILLAIVFISAALAVYFSPTTIFPEWLPRDLMGDYWLTMYGGGSIPQAEGQYQTETFSLVPIPGWERTKIVDTVNKAVVWNWNFGSTTMFTYTLPQESCRKLGGMSLYLTFKHNAGSQWDSYSVDECRNPNPPKEQTVVVDSNPVIVTIQIQGQSCPDGEAVGYTYGYRQIDETQPMTYSLVGETEIHEIDLSTQDTMINFQGYNDALEPYGYYADQTRVLHNATCTP
jgi:hypothetical protein